MLAFGHASLRAGRLDCRINHFLVAKGLDRFLRLQFLAADRALLSVRQTSFRTGRCLTGNRHHSVLLHGNHFLCNDDRMTDGAVLAIGLAGRGAGSFNGFVNNLGVTRSRNNLGLCFFADRAGVGLYSVRYTAGFGSNHTLIPLMVTHGNFPLTVCVRNCGTRSDLCSLSIGVVCVV